MSNFCKSFVRIVRQIGGQIEVDMNKNFFYNNKLHDLELVLV